MHIHDILGLILIYRKPAGVYNSFDNKCFINIHKIMNATGVNYAKKNRHQ